MKLLKKIIIVSILLLTATTMVPCMSAATPENFHPNVGEEISNEEMQENINNYTPPDMVPESEMAYLYFSESWFMKNDEDPLSDTVQLTFPVKWLDQPPIRDNERVVLFRVPMELLDSRDENPNPEIITVSFLDRWFKKFPNLSVAKLNAAKLSSQAQKNDSETDLENSEKLSEITIQNDALLSGTKNMEQQTRAYFHRNTSLNIVRIYGIMAPGTFENDDDETFYTYHEREFYLDGVNDTVEFILQYTQDGQCNVWAAVWDYNGSLATNWNWLNFDITDTYEDIEYDLYINNGNRYTLWLCDEDGDCASNIYYDTDNPSTRIEKLMGSTELDTMGGINEIFLTTSKIYDQKVKTSGGLWLNPKVAFYEPEPIIDAQYVYIQNLTSSTQTKTKHVSGSDY